MKRTRPTWRDGAWWVHDPDTNLWSRWDPASARWEPMGWQPPPHGSRRGRGAPDGGRSRLGDRARALLIVAALIAVNLPGLWGVLRSLFEDEPCPASASIVEETRLSNVPDGALFTMLPEHPHDRRLTMDVRTDLSFAAQGHGSTPGAEQDWRDALTLHGFRDGRLLAWGGRAGVAPQANWAHTNQFASPEHALSFHRWAAAWTCRFMRGVFTVPGLPGSVGTRFDWRSGHTTEQVSFVRGDLRAVVFADVAGTYRREDLIALTRSVYDEIGAPGICDTGIEVVPSVVPAPAVRHERLLDFVPQELGGVSVSRAEHSASFRLESGETVQRAYAMWQGGRWYATLEILQFGSAERAAGWTRRTLRFACDAGRAVVRPGPEEIAGSLEPVTANAPFGARHIYFLRGPRAYHVAVFGSATDVTLDFVSEVASVMNEHAG